ncbi:MAG: Serine hydroxymethyltransferase [Parcubacteria group bacterium ADurb.Bin159]|nr:MAG: Serine hydroxymethyltransferase [Parcubacteria group bacterium ADurb.Bin159]
MQEKIEKVDSCIANLIKKEEERQLKGLGMIPSENFASPAVLTALSSKLTNKYSEGYPYHRYYSGNKYIDQIELIAQERAKSLFKADFANVQPHSGTQANMACYFALLKPKDKILAMNLKAGGHLSHGSPVSFSGNLFHFIHYGVETKTNLIDYNQIEKLTKKYKPKMIISGASSYPRKINFKYISQIAHKYGAYHLADIAHIAGLIVAGLHPSPFPSADLVTSTTQKTLRGPRGGIILGKKNFEKIINKMVFPGIQGGPAENIIAAKAVCFKEAQTLKFKNYQKQVIENAKILAKTLMKQGLKLVTNGTDNHLLLIDLRTLNLGGIEAENILENIGIYTNKNVIPFDTASPNNPSGLRLGTPALTTRGMKEKEMEIIGKIIADILKNSKNKKIADQMKKQVSKITQKFPYFK